MKVEELNQAIDNDTIGELIRVAEARQIKEISRIADRVCEDHRVRLVLIAGGSSSGKTTTSKRLCTQLRVNGREALSISTDDYFVGDARNPRNERGELDYEHVDCVDIPLLVGDLNRLLDGGEIPRRRFDFMTHEPARPDGVLRLPKDGFVVMEGIHALNPRLVSGVSDEAKFRIHIDPRPAIEVYAGIVPTSSEARFLRRMVRDNRFRKLSPVRTLQLWPGVLAGESKWIEPFTGNADAFFNSYLEYELAVLKTYVGGLLELARHELGNAPMLMAMADMLQPVKPLSDAYVPGDSILREVIGGSQLDY